MNPSQLATALADRPLTARPITERAAGAGTYLAEDEKGQRWALKLYGPDHTAYRTERETLQQLERFDAPTPAGGGHRRGCAGAAAELARRPDAGSGHQRARRRPADRTRPAGFDRGGAGVRPDLGTARGIGSDHGRSPAPPRRGGPAPQRPRLPPGQSRPGRCRRPSASHLRNRLAGFLELRLIGLLGQQPGDRRANR